MISDAAADRFLASNWLAEMDEESRREVIRHLEEVRAEKGTVLLQPGHANDRIGFLLEGSVKVTMAVDRGATAEIITIEPPSMIGLTTFFRSAAPGFTARAATPVWYLRLKRSAYEAMREQNPRAAEQLALAAIHVLADRIEILDQRIRTEVEDHPDEHTRVTEWNRFRSRLFEDSVL